MSAKGNNSVLDVIQVSDSQKALTRLLVKLNLLNPEQLNQRHIFHEYEPIAHFAKFGLFNERDAIEKVASYLRKEAKFFKAEDAATIAKILQSDPISKIEISKWRKYKAVPLGLSNKKLRMVLANPYEVDFIRMLEFELQVTTDVLIGAEREILAMLNNQVEKGNGLDFNMILNSGPVTDLRTVSPSQTNNESNVTADDISAPTIIRLVNKIFSGSVQKGASDLHISPENGRLLVRIRLDGIMQNLLEVPEGYKDAIIARIKVLCGMDITEKRNPQDGRLRLKTSYGERDLRISTVPTVYGENLVARILAQDVSHISLEKIDMPENVRYAYKKALSGSSKVILVAGPTGSGKTSTVYAGLQELRDGTSNIITIEDPIEYRIQGVNQIQINTKVDMTFAKALRSVLRQDPDIVMVGEIRDSETAGTAMQVAQTGHLVLSTIHSNSAGAVITRLRDLKIPSYLIASSLGAILAQRLIRRLCEACKQPATPEEVQKAGRLGVHSEKLFTACGCEKCDKTGYKGRVGVFSFMTVNAELAEAIRSEKSEVEIERIAGANGYLSLEASAKKLIEDGTTSLIEAQRMLGIFEECEPDLEVSDHTIHHESSDIIPKRKVLIVDDDENMRAIYHMILEYEMFEVSEAQDGAEALKMIYQGPPDIILCDLMMPRMSGLEMLEKLRQNPKTKDIPVLMLTAAASEDNELKLIKSGASDFLSKTSKTEIIMARLNRLLNH